MFATKITKDKRKKLSESRNGDTKIGVSEKRVSQNNRSSSMHRDKKELRFNTEYKEY